MKAKLLNGFYHFLGRCARGYLAKHKPLIVGINGSVGKTTCRTIIYQTIEHFVPKGVKIYSSPKNFNGELGMSLSIFTIERRSPTILSLITTGIKALRMRRFGRKLYDVILLEYGIDRPGEMSFLLSIAKPHFGVFTKIDAVHSLQFGTPKDIAQEEIKMIQYTQDVAYLNSDDTYAQQLSHMIDIDQFFYRTSIEENDIMNEIDFEASELNYVRKKVVTDFVSKIHKKKIHVRTNLMERQNYGYIGVGLSIADTILYRLKNKSIFERAEVEKNSKEHPVVLNYTLLPGRFTILPGVHDSILVDSSYNAAPQSVKKTLENVFRLRRDLFPERKIIAILGEMRELGDFEEKEHRLIATHIGQIVDYPIFVGKAVDHTIDEMKKMGVLEGYAHYKSSRDAARDAINYMKKLKEEGQEFIVLCKGSQNTIFTEEASKRLLADPADQKHLVRQSDFWLKTKEKFFASVEKPGSPSLQ